VWQGSDGNYNEDEYGSHGEGTFNVNPVGGLAGFWIGETPLSDTLAGYVATSHTGNVTVVGTVAGPCCAACAPAPAATSWADPRGCGRRPARRPRRRRRRRPSS
jgi:hypothetical protein